ncbi:MAG: hypothetical protein Aureis2KO_14970 [Aureisphaera sp.]
MRIKTVYIANILVATWIGIISLFFPESAADSIFGGFYESNGVIRMVGAIWLAIGIVSVIGLWKPLKMSIVLLMQFMYMSAWLLLVAVPAIFQKQPYPKEIALFFLIWVAILPFVIPWKALVRKD